MSSKFLISTSWSFTAVAFRAAGGVVINKLFALFLGTNGITLLSHFQNLSSLFTLLPSEGVNRSIMKYWADPREGKAAKNKLLQTGFWATHIIFILTFALLFWNRAFFFDRFVKAYSLAEFLYVFIPAILLMLLSGLLNAVILAAQDVKSYAIITIAGVFLLVSTVFAGVYWGTLDQALLSFVTGYGLMCFCSVIYFIIHRRRFSFRPGWLDRGALKKIVRFMAMALSVIVFGKLLDFVVRDHVIGLYGLDRTGLWQAVAKISNSYLMIFIGTVGVVYYPRIASLIHTPKVLRNYVLKVMGFVAFAAIVGLTVYYVNRGFFLRLLFADGFEEAGYLVRYQALGDFFAMLAYLLAYLLSVRVEIWKYMSAQLVSALVYIGLISVLIGPYGLEALTMAYMGRHIGFFIMLVLFNRSLFRWIR